MRIDIYGKTQCPYCDMAKRLAKQVCNEASQEGYHTYNYYQLDRDFTREELMEKFPTAKTFPQIKIDHKSIGGYKEFEAYIKDIKGA